jgi:hypothetical protein
VSASETDSFADGRKLGDLGGLSPVQRLARLVQPCAEIMSNAHTPLRGTP